MMGPRIGETFYWLATMYAIQSNQIQQIIGINVPLHMFQTDGKLN